MNSNQFDYIGIDVAKNELVIFSSLGLKKFSNNAPGWQKLRTHVSTLANPLVVLEASGGYERPLIDYLCGVQLPWTLINPARVRYYAKSEGSNVKSDPIDASIIYKFACNKQLQPSIIADDVRRQLVLLMDRRTQISDMITQEKNRLDKCADPRVLNSIKALICYLEQELADYEKLISKHIESCEQLRERKKVMTEIKGVGDMTASTILAYLPEIETLQRNKIVALAGLAPYDRDSGNSKRKRFIYGGRHKVRKCLYMAAVSASKHNEVIKAYFTKLTNKNKPYKSAITACMRKLLIYIHSLLRKMAETHQNEQISQTA